MLFVFTDGRNRSEAEVKSFLKPATRRAFATKPGRINTVKTCDRHIIETLKIANDMIDLADRGDADREDTGCGVLYGVMRDSAYKIRALAENEKRRHLKKGW